MRCQTRSSVALKALGAILQPGGHVLPVLPDCLESGVIPGSVLPVELVHGENVVGVEAPAVELPESQCSPHPPIPIGQGMDRLESVMDDS